jgi:hypothetical protein
VINAFAAVGVAGAVPVEIFLSNSDGLPAAGFVENGDSSRVVVVPWLGTTGIDGTLTVEMFRNEDIDPDNTCYVVAIGHGAAATKFVIQKKSGTEQLLDCLIASPVPLGSLFGIGDLSNVDTGGAVVGQVLKVASLNPLETVFGDEAVAPATDSTAGSMSAADKTKVDALGSASTHAATDFAAAADLTSEASTRAAADTANAGAIASEASTRASADATNASAISAETARATGAEATKFDTPGVGMKALGRTVRPGQGSQFGPGLVNWHLALAKASSSTPAIVWGIGDSELELAGMLGGLSTRLAAMWNESNRQDPEGYSSGFSARGSLFGALGFLWSGSGSAAANRGLTGQAVQLTNGQSCQMSGAVLTSGPMTDGATWFWLGGLAGSSLDLTWDGVVVHTVSDASVAGQWTLPQTTYGRHIPGFTSHGTTLIDGVNPAAYRPVQYWNLGHSGSTTEQWLAYTDLAYYLATLKPSAIINELGGNDEGQGDSAATFLANTTSLIGIEQANCSASLIQLLISNVSAHQVNTQYLATQQQISETFGIPLIDLGPFFPDLYAHPESGSGGTYTLDGIHYNTTAIAITARVAASVLMGGEIRSKAIPTSVADLVDPANLSAALSWQVGSLTIPNAGTADLYLTTSGFTYLGITQHGVPSSQFVGFSAPFFVPEVVWGGDAYIARTGTKALAMSADNGFTVTGLITASAGLTAGAAITAGSGVTGLPAPSGSTDAVRKSYVDALTPASLVDPANSSAALSWQIGSLTISNSAADILADTSGFFFVGITAHGAPSSQLVGFSAPFFVPEVTWGGDCFLARSGTKALNMSADNGLTLSGPLAMSAKKITGLALATASTDGASLANKVSDFAAAGADIAMGTHKLTGLSQPSAAGQSIRYEGAVRRVFTDVTSHGNTNDTNNDTLLNQSLGSGLFANDGDSVHWHCEGLFANNTHSKRVILQVGTTLTTVWDSGTIAFTGSTADSWNADVWITRKSSTTIEVSVQVGWKGSGTPATPTASQTITTTALGSNAVTVKSFGATGTAAANDVTQEVGWADYHPASL